MKKKKKLKKKSIYVVLTMTGTLPARIIKFYTGEPYSHASIAFDEDLQEMYSFARRTVHNPFNAGFVREYIDSGIFGIYKEITTSLALITWHTGIPVLFSYLVKS